MTTKKQLIRIGIIIVSFAVVFLVGREVFYARNATRSSLQIQMSGQDLAKNSTAIVSATVEKSLGTIRFTDANGEIMVNTRWQISVDKAYKGSMTGSEIVQIPGGRYGLTEIIVEDAATLAEGEKVLLYLSPFENSGEYQITGMFQGRYDAVTQNGQTIFQQPELKISKTAVELEQEIKATGV